LIWHYEKINCPGGSISCIGIKIVGQKHIYDCGNQTQFFSSFKNNQHFKKGNMCIVGNKNTRSTASGISAGHVLLLPACVHKEIFFRKLR
jgi:hypothetical protein